MTSWCCDVTGLPHSGITTTTILLSLGRSWTDLQNFPLTFYPLLSHSRRPFPFLSLAQYFPQNPQRLREVESTGANFINLFRWNNSSFSVPSKRSKGPSQSSSMPHWKLSATLLSKCHRWERLMGCGHQLTKVWLFVQTHSDLNWTERLISPELSQLLTHSRSSFSKKVCSSFFFIIIALTQSCSCSAFILCLLTVFNVI